MSSSLVSRPTMSPATRAGSRTLTPSPARPAPATSTSPSLPTRTALCRPSTACSTTWTRPTSTPRVSPSLSARCSSVSPPFFLLCAFNVVLGDSRWRCPRRHRSVSGERGDPGSCDDVRTCVPPTTVLYEPWACVCRTWGRTLPSSTRPIPAEALPYRNPEDPIPPLQTPVHWSFG